MEEHTYQQVIGGLKQKPKDAITQGGLPAFKASEFNPDAPSVDPHVNYFCPDCATLDHAIAPTLK
ncbi:hypothetical protein OZX57_05510 [Bifidobacterium sp. ESL0682]|uniref:hypothetical protein n=1 Tax=Bifidobacterium sp. ESL0682 TaxID=2983212 RepID=UPI0023F92FAD|nr:hypothetical protein [Bifidobacterium sp. ESL0682]WEV41492.1 hypothetical protein OZX57_05510 [Bifidobacterium sp. ESL0682]